MMTVANVGNSILLPTALPYNWLLRLNGRPRHVGIRAASANNARVSGVSYG